MQYDTRARLLAVEILLADPETLGNDALETDLYLLRDQLTGTAGDERSPSPDAPVVRRVSVAGVARGEHDLAARSQEILRREVGHPGE